MLWWTKRRAQSQDPEVRKRSIGELGRLGTPPALEILCEMLVDENQSVRQMAASELDRAGYKPTDSETVARILVLLGRYEDAALAGPVAVPLLIDCLTSPEGASKAAAAIQHMGDPAVDLLSSALRGENLVLVNQAADILGKIRTDRAAAALAAALIWASSEGHDHLLKTLIASGADVNARSNEGETALMRAVAWEHRGDERRDSFVRHHHVVVTLIAAEADVNARDQGNWTPLMRSSRAGNDEVTTPRSGVIKAALPAKALPSQNQIQANPSPCHSKAS